MSQAEGIDTRYFRGWRCDCCGRLITNIADGWVEWLAFEDEYGTTIVGGVRLTHRRATGARTRGRGCRYDARKEFRNNASIVEGLALERFVGPDGLMLLLSLVEAGEFRKQDLLELAKRVQVPGYELVRDLICEATAGRVCTPFLGKKYYLQSEMQELLAWASEESKRA
jgi:hypothetical protein